MTAAAVARAELKGWRLNPMTLLNIKKVTAFRKNGAQEFRALVRAIKPQMPGGGKDRSSRTNADEGEGEFDPDMYREKDLDAKESGDSRGKRQQGRRSQAEEDDEWEDLEEAAEVNAKGRGRGPARRGVVGRGRKSSGNKYAKERGRGHTEKASF